MNREPLFVTQTLKWCNKQRELKNLEPLDRLPKGKKGDGKSCPCGKATGLNVGIYWVNDLLGRRVGKLPESVAKFVIEFDEGRLPQYDEDPEGED